MATFVPGQNYDPTAGGAVPGTTGSGSVGIDQELGLSAQEAALSIAIRRSDVGAGQNPYSPNLSNITFTTPSRSLRDMLNSWRTMNPGDLEQLQQQLYQGGFYPRSYYTSGQQPAWGDLNDTAGFSAWRSVLRSAATSRRPYEDIVDAGGIYKNLASQLAASGGAAGTTGLFHEYAVSDPAELRAIVDKAAVDTLGHKLSDKERGALVDAVIASQRTKGQEQATAKSAAMSATAGTGQPQNAPVSGSGQTRADFANAVLSGLGVQATPENVRALTAWMQAEGGTAAFNPMNTTQQAAGATDYNSAGVKNFTSWEQGVQATVQTLKNGRYGNIIQALQQGNNAGAVAAAVGQSPWGTSGQLMSQILGSTPTNAAVSTAAAGITTPTAAVPGIAIQGVNPQADVTEQIRAEHPLEAAAHDYTDVYGMALNFIRKAA